MAKKPETLSVGYRVGRLEVIGDMVRVGPAGNQRAAYPVRCDCGTERVMPLNKLRGGQLSCGCIRKERPGTKTKLIEVGTRFGKLTVTGPYEMRPTTEGDRAFYPVACDCGNEIMAAAKRLLVGNMISCGCIREFTGQSNSRIYQTYNNMVRRCTEITHPAYPDYGGRGITVCREWLDRFGAFYDWTMASGYRDDLTIERIDVNGHYEPGNCTWIPRGDQARNKRDTQYLEAFGERKRVREWVDDPRCVVDYFTLYRRLRYGWSPEIALTTLKLRRPQS